MALSPAVLPNPARIRAAWEEVLERARRVPGVEAVAMVDTVPMREGHNENGYWTSAAVPPDDRQPVALSTCVTPDYLKVMGIPLRAGRFFDDHDRMGSQPVIVIDDVLARSAFPGEDAVGRAIVDSRDGDRAAAGGGGSGARALLGAGGRRSVEGARAVLLSVRAGAGRVGAAVVAADVDRRAHDGSAAERGAAAAARTARRGQRPGAVRGAHAGATGRRRAWGGSGSCCCCSGFLRGLALLLACDRDLRRAGVSDGAARAGIRSAHGAGRDRRRCARAGVPAEPGDDHGRRGAWERRRRWRRGCCIGWWRECSRRMR